MIKFPSFIKAIFITSFLLMFPKFCWSRIHRLKIVDDYRSHIPLSSFGFYKNGYLTARFENFHYEPQRDTSLFGFTLERVKNNPLESDTEAYHTCVLKELGNKELMKKDIVFFTIDLKNKQLRINCSQTLHNLRIYENIPSFSEISDQNFEEPGVLITKERFCTNLTLPIQVESTSNGDIYNTKFAIYVATENEEGMYSLSFQNCANYKDEDQVGVFFTMEIEARNYRNFLSAGEIPLPALYFMMSAIFFISGSFWIFILVKSRHPVFKIHYLMAALVMLKSITLLFHGFNYHFIQIKGEHIATWAILYYVTNLLKGSVLFITLILIGTGWTFIKHILSQKDKKIFMIVIPLQVFANIAEIVIEESEEGDAEYQMWSSVFMIVDLLCCAAVMLPVIWSIRHLQDASHTDGKAAINLKKLKLFRQFYLMILCYIYFTRMVVYLLKMSVPFQYEWFDEMFKELATFVFFVLTGYKFRPASPNTNPYFELDEHDDDSSVIIGQCNFAEGLTKLSKISNEEADDDKDTLLIFNRENSHDYD